MMIQSILTATHIPLFVEALQDNTINNSIVKEHTQAILKLIEETNAQNIMTVSLYRKRLFEGFETCLAITDKSLTKKRHSLKFEETSFKKFEG